MNNTTIAYYARNTVTGSFWNGTDFSATAPEGNPSAVPLTATRVPGDALPLMRATWDNVEAIEAGALHRLTGVKEAMRAVKHAVERVSQQRQHEQHKQQAAARREKQRTDGAAYVAKLTAAALELAASRPTNPDDKAECRLAMMKANTAEAWLGARESLTERAERMAHDPAGYFEWADGDMENAANIELYGRIIHAVADGKDFAEAHAAAISYLTRALLQNSHRANSTSAIHNAMEEARRSAASRFIDRAAWN